VVWYFHASFAGFDCTQGTPAVIVVLLSAAPVVVLLSVT
jgi:hypothetical protein